MKDAKYILDQDDRFALYSLPGADDHFLIQQKQDESGHNLHSIHEPGFIMHPFIAGTHNPIIHLTADLFVKNPTVKFTTETDSNLRSTQKSDYLELATDFIKACNSEFTKLVLSRIEVLENGGKNLFSVFCKLKEKYPDAFVYLFNHPFCGTWMGASPEVFLQKNKDSIHTMAMAGTRSADAAGELSSPWTDKEREEQSIVSEYIKECLENKGLAYDFKGPKDHKAGNLYHLKSTFDFEIPEKGFKSLVADLHPTPAVCGIPKKEALAWISSMETHDRDYYTGFLGPTYIEGTTSLFVNLRCIKLSKSQFVLYLGGGITSSSDAQSEWEETQVKSNTMKAVLI